MSDTKVVDHHLTIAGSTIRQAMAELPSDAVIYFALERGRFSVFVTSHNERYGDACINGTLPPDAQLRQAIRVGKGELHRETWEG